MLKHSLPTLSALVLMLAASHAGAQTTTGTASGDAALDSVIKAGTEVLRQEAEAAAGRAFTPEQIKIIKDVLSAAGIAVPGSPSTGDDPDSDAAETEDGDGKNKGHKGKKGKGGGKAKGKGKKDGLPPGLAKKDQLPPGLQKRLDRGDPLPPGLAKRSLPPTLDRELGPAAPNTERVIVDNDVVLMDRAAGVVLDIVRDVIKGSGQ